MGRPFLRNTLLLLGCKHGAKDGLGRKMVLALCFINFPKDFAEEWQQWLKSAVFPWNGCRFFESLEGIEDDSLHD